MKKIVYPIFALALLASCDVLDKQPLTAISPSSFFKTSADAESGITGSYDILQSTGLYSQDLIVLGEMPSDNCTSINLDVRDLAQMSWSSTTSQTSNLYRDAYQGINRVNTVLKYIPGISMDETRKTEILGEAKFLRALHYFNLVRAFGGVPLRLEPTESGTPEVLNLPRANAADVYTQVIADLNDAATTMPATNPRRAARGAALALLVRVYLTQRQWALAQQTANQIITGGSYRLETNFKNLFPADNKGESILEVQNSGTADGNNILPDLLLPSPPATYSFSEFNIPTLYRSASESRPTDLTFAVDTVQDLRWAYRGRVTGGRDHASYIDGKNSNENDKGPFVYKWPGNPNSFNSLDNTYIMRYAEVLLAYAEATNELSGPTADALAKLNLVRERAGLTALTSTSPEAASKQTLRNEIDKQRRLELAFEGERWFDLVRYARHNQVEAGAHTITALDIIAQKRQGQRDANYLLFPLPLGELNTNPSVAQNPGY
ncbi:RagB/SusD family nutrient uptake outer membrane protein [Hymenobacter sediminis]|uniref:RagB/SusD family nutrient uptake outer membrane protein n=1 Tax=Hymenobacter sediminis TaxID=2218621 RepID=UPI000DA6AB94|nr:RagB/SusD family nutrient uptake outer membrane protein [Hymenobacter sediminis]RPD45047.1 RagB/SusD family nutrient uptake outer membrane protein [Hymenobacter sediminis]